MNMIKEHLGPRGPPNINGVLGYTIMYMYVSFRKMLARPPVGKTDERTGPCKHVMWLTARRNAVTSTTADVALRAASMAL